MIKKNSAALTRKRTVRRLKLQRIIGSSLGALLGIGVVAYLSAASGKSILLPSFGATCFIAFVIPDSDYAQPFNIIGGHALCSGIGLLCLNMIGTAWWGYALAVSMSVAAMQLFRVTHPPAAADPLVILMDGRVSWVFLLNPVILGSLLLVGVALIYNRYIAQRSYPRGGITRGRAGI